MPHTLATCSWRRVCKLSQQLYFWMTQLVHHRALSFLTALPSILPHIQACLTQAFASLQHHFLPLSRATSANSKAQHKRFSGEVITPIDQFRLFFFPPFPFFAWSSIFLRLWYRPVACCNEWGGDLSAQLIIRWSYVIQTRCQEETPTSVLTFLELRSLLCFEFLLGGCCCVASRALYSLTRQGICGLGSGGGKQGGRP